MAWVINLPLSTNTTLGDTSIPPVFDGGNVWLVDNAQTACIEFWGPYHDLSNDDYSRYSAPEIIEEERLTLGPSTRVLHTFSHGLDSVIWAAYHEDHIYVMGIVDGETTIVRWHTAASDSSDVTVLCTTDDVGSTFAIGNGKIFFVSKAEPEIQSTEKQSLFWVVIDDCDGDYLVSGTLEIDEIKRFDTRYLEFANDHVYVSSDLGVVRKYSTATPALVESILVYTRLDRIVRVQNDIYCFAGHDTGSTGILLKIDADDEVSSIYGILDWDVEGDGCACVGEDDGYIWFSNHNGGFQRIDTSNGRIVSSVLQLGDGAYVNNNDVIVADGGVLNNIRSIFVSPQFTYQWWNGSSFDDIDVPQYLMLFYFSTTMKVLTVRLPSWLKFENSFSIRQYTAVSSGPLHSKVIST